MNLSTIKNLVLTSEEYLPWSERIYYFLEEYTKYCPASHKKNYQTEDWRNVESSFLKCTFHKRRFDSGCITLTLDENKIVALSACYKFNSKIAYLSSRSCVLPGYEKLHLISSIHIPLQQAFFKNQIEFGIISFNTDRYSLRVMNTLEKRKKWSESKALRLSGKEYFNFIFLKDKTFNIHGTEQLVAYCCFSEKIFQESFLLDE